MRPEKDLEQLKIEMLNIFQGSMSIDSSKEDLNNNSNIFHPNVLKPIESPTRIDNTEFSGDSYKKLDPTQININLQLDGTKSPKLVNFNKNQTQYNVNIKKNDKTPQLIQNYIGMDKVGRDPSALGLPPINYSKFLESTKTPENNIQHTEHKNVYMSFLTETPYNFISTNSSVYVKEKNTANNTLIQRYDTSSNPVNNLTSNVTNTTLPVNNLTSNVTNTTLPVNNLTSNVTNTTLPVNNLTSNVTNTTLPVNNLTSNVTNTTLPANNLTSNVTNTTLPANNLTSNVTNTTLPVNNLTSNVTNTTLPVNNLTSNVTNTTLPVNNLTSNTNYNIFNKTNQETLNTSTSDSTIIKQDIKPISNIKHIDLGSISNINNLTQENITQLNKDQINSKNYSFFGNASYYKVQADPTENTNTFESRFVGKSEAKEIIHKKEKILLIPAFADGGFVGKSTVAMVGERGTETSSSGAVFKSPTVTTLQKNNTILPTTKTSTEQTSSSIAQNQKMQKDDKSSDPSKEKLEDKVDDLTKAFVESLKPKGEKEPKRQTNPNPRSSSMYSSLTQFMMNNASMPDHRLSKE